MIWKIFLLFLCIGYINCDSSETSAEISSANESTTILSSYEPERSVEKISHYTGTADCG